MEDEPTLRALRQAQALELEGIRFYDTAAHEAQDAQVRQTFRDLASDERDHLRLIQAQLQALKEGTGWRTFPETAAIKPLNGDKALFVRGWEALQQAAPPGATPLEALRFGLEIENRSFELYWRAAQETSAPEGRAMFQSLAQAERDHFDILMMRYESLAGPAGWTA